MRTCAGGRLAAAVLLATVLGVHVVTQATASPSAQRPEGGRAARPDVANPSKICHNSTPCGWHVYARFSRHPVTFVRNTCDCPEGRHCIREEDDLSASAYVYRCKPLTEATTIAGTTGEGEGTTITAGTTPAAE